MAAFTRTAGYENLPKGNFSPTIYSKKAQLAFRKTSVIQAITNTEYFGEISAFGDTVRIIKEPNITVSAYTRGQNVTPQDLDDEELTLTVDKANKFSFKVDDIEVQQAHHNWEQMATDQGGYRLADAMDSEIITYMTTQVTTANTTGTNGDPADLVTAKAAGDFTPLQLMNKFQRLLDEANVPAEGRWFVADPYFYELLGDEDSQLLSADYTSKGIVRNGRISDGIVRGFTLHKSNNMLTVGTGPTATSGSNYGWILAGHMSSTATAEQINNVEVIRDPHSFADIIRGLHVYGRKVLRTEAIVASRYHTA